MTDPRHGKFGLRNAFLAFAFFLLAFYWLVVATYPTFFIFNPFDEPWGLRQAFLVISLVGWILISTVPAVVLGMYAAGKNDGIKLLPYVAILWPASVVGNQILLFIRDQVWYFDYLLNYPIFIATDIILPLLLLVLWWDLKEVYGKHEITEQLAEQS